MIFSEIRAKDICSVLRYNTNMTRWTVQDRKDHIIGIKFEGSAMHYLKNNKFVISRNCVYFLNQKDDYTVDVYEPGESLSIHFTTYEDIDTESFCIPVSNPDEFITILKKAETASVSKNNLSLLCFLYMFCAKIDKLLKKPYHPTDNRIIAAKEYIDAHFHEKDCFNKTVLASGLTACRLGELFRNKYDMTLNQYITHQKIEYAKLLLSTQELSISDISTMCGFSDIYYFSKTFKMHTGISPSKWIYQSFPQSST